MDRKQVKDEALNKDTFRAPLRCGFTLVELLVVVLIIGVLAAIALPMYQKAVMKSRFAALMPIGKSMADSNEAYYLEHGRYAFNAQELPVQGQSDYDDGTKLEFGTTSEYAYVLASRAQANNKPFPNHYIVYQKHSENFPGNIHCEADENNDMAKELCLSLGGQKIDGSLSDGFITYALSGMRGEKDKLPTSLNKLKAQLCAGIPDENCVVDDDNETITAYTCGTLGDSSGDLYWWLSGSGGDSNGCIGTQYDLDGNPAGTRNIRCSNGTTPNEDKTACVGTPTSTSSVYEDIREGNRRYYKSCVKIQNNQCTQMRLDNTTYYDGSSAQQHKIGYTCEPSQIKADRTCNSYIALTGDQAPRGAERKENPQGNTTWEIQCTHRNSDGICTSMKEGEIRTYAANGTTKTGQISVSCTVSHRWDTNPCTEYSLTYSGNATGPATCPADRLNFDTFECAPESAG